jgi:Protein of unknown function (DUF2892)
MSFDFKRMIKFEHNVGEKEKKYRLYGGAALIAISIFTASIALLLIGMVLVATGFSGFCPAYAGLGKNTCCAGHESETGDSTVTGDSSEPSDKSEENN